jgi:AraC-like DNA-binding protein
MNDSDRLYSLFSIFKIFANTKEFRILSSPASMNSFSSDENDPMQKALKYILQNFQKPIHLKDLLEITSMSNTAFYDAFKHNYRMTYKNFLLNIRIGYACRLLTDESMNISEIAYTCGFENLSNFNRQFKQIKGITPRLFVEQLIKNRPNSN